MICESCYFGELLRRRIEIDVPAFSTEEGGERFRSFGQWLGNEVGLQKAAIQLHRYLDRFLHLEAMGGASADAVALLEMFGTIALKGNSLFARYLTSEGVTFSREARSQAAERRRIDQILRDTPGGAAQQSIRGFHHELLRRHGERQTALQSVRLALRPAADLLRLAGSRSHRTPTQADLDWYLGHHPGQRAAMSGFVGYLKSALGVRLALPKAGFAKSSARRKLEAELLSILRQPKLDDRGWQELTRKALCYLHGVPRSLMSDPTKLKLIASTGAPGTACLTPGGRYWLPISR